MTDGPKPTPLGERLLEQRELRGWSQEQMSEAANIATGRVSHLETGKRGVRVGRDQAIKIAKAFGEPVEWWLDLAGISYDDSTPKEYRPTVAEAIEYDLSLTKPQKRRLRDLYERYRSSPYV